MRVELLVDNQFGPLGPQSGDELRVFDFRIQPDDEVWFFCWWDKDFPGEQLYFVLPPKFLRTIHE